uniref:Uncharacterized protein n=1 Tax=Rhizophora mucronata TaxID=61149 RepID=A0A2P2L103_RHIMU
MGEILTPKTSHARSGYSRSRNECIQTKSSESKRRKRIGGLFTFFAR